MGNLNIPGLNNLGINFNFSGFLSGLGKYKKKEDFEQDIRFASFMEIYFERIKRYGKVMINMTGILIIMAFLFFIEKLYSYETIFNFFVAFSGISLGMYYIGKFLEKAYKKQKEVKTEKWKTERK